MSLPIRTTLEDVTDICTYLATKPTGATVGEAKTVLDSKRLDWRKLNALKFWGLLEPGEERLILTPAGREFARGDTWRRSVCLQITRNIPAYRSIIERSFMRKEDSVSSTDVAAHWYQHFREEAGTSDKIVNDQALCFFHIANGAELGTTVVGRHGSSTRLQYIPDNVASFMSGQVGSATHPTTAPIPPPRAAKSTPKERELPATAHEPREPPSVEAPQSQMEGHYLQRGLVVDCYRLVERLGSGFSAEVWSAEVLRVPSGVDIEQGKHVAIKFYTANALAMPHQVIRIEREYRVAQRLRHPHLIRIYEFMLASPRPNHSFLVMDIAPGPALSAAIKQRKFEPSESLKMLAQILSAADALHEAGALHRDIKPGNISLSTDHDGSPHCVLLDLGIVSPLFEKSVTAVSRFVGSKHWAPLEQLIGGDLDQRSDLYSIGAVAYNLLVGIEPFSGSPTEAAVAVEMSRNGLEIPNLANLPSEIVQLFNACLSNSPKDRPRSAQECLSLLRRHEIVP